MLEKRKCTFDQCCEFSPMSWNHMYCFEHNCKRKAESQKRREATLANEGEQFEQPREFKELGIKSAPDGYKVLIFNDLQRPFHDQKTLTAFEHFWDDFKPDLEVYAGDIVDFYNISSFDRNPSRRFSLQDEIDGTTGWLDYRVHANPGARRIWLNGNHEDRMRRWLWKHGPELSSLRDLTLDSLLSLEAYGFETLDYGSVLDFLGYRIQHGKKTTMSNAYPVNVSRWMALATGSSGLCGHTHRFSVYSWTNAKGSHSYIENGCLCRFDMEYNPFPNWQQAFTYGIVHNNKIHLVPVQIYTDGFRAEGQFYVRK